jgi:two-component SAPR family response regulator
MRAIIIEDDKIFIKILEELISKNEQVELVDVFNNAEDAVEFLKEEIIDLIFLDVELPKMSGLDLVPLIDKKTQIIFVTGDKNYAADAFDFNAIDYLVKPISANRFNKAIEKAKEVYEILQGLVIG